MGQRPSTATEKVGHRRKCSLLSRNTHTKYQDIWPRNTHTKYQDLWIGTDTKIKRGLLRYHVYYHY